MRFEELALAGAFVVSPERHDDPPGWFARTFCHDEFTAHGLNGDFIQCGASFNARRGTLRGMHWQRAPHAETKLIRCTRGGCSMCCWICAPAPQSSAAGRQPN